MYKVLKVNRGYKGNNRDSFHQIQGLVYRDTRYTRYTKDTKGDQSFSAENQTTFLVVYKVYKVYEGYETFSLKTRNFAEGYTRCTRYTKDTRVTAKATDP